MATETRTIQWQRDVDAALASARATQRPVLLDFTAAPQ
jgi:thiol:disulfide interchange protein